MCFFFKLQKAKTKQRSLEIALAFYQNGVFIYEIENRDSFRKSRNPSEFQRYFFFYHITSFLLYTNIFVCSEHVPTKFELISIMFYNSYFNGLTHLYEKNLKISYFISLVDISFFLNFEIYFNLCTEMYEIGCWLISVSKKIFSLGSEHFKTAILSHGSIFFSKEVFY